MYIGYCRDFSITKRNCRNLELNKMMKTFPWKSAWHLGSQHDINLISMNKEKISWKFLGRREIRSPYLWRQAFRGIKSSELRECHAVIISSPLLPATLRQFLKCYITSTKLSCVTLLLCKRWLYIFLEPSKQNLSTISFVL